MRYLFLLLFALGISSMALAAEITPEISLTNGGYCTVWEEITTGDTTASGQWRGGKGTVEVNGVLDNAELEVYYSRVSGNEISIDSDNAPDGLSFSSATGLGATNIDAAQGFFTINFSSAGGASQDLDVSICAVPQLR